MVDQFARVSFPDCSPYVLKLPLLDIEVSFNGLIQQVGAVAVQRFGKIIQCFHLLCIQTETDSLLIHIMQ